MTATDFAPYPGFVADPYKEYSQPWFSSPHKCFAAAAGQPGVGSCGNTWRNFYPPDRRDVLGRIPHLRQRRDGGRPR